MVGKLKSKSLKILSNFFLYQVNSGEYCAQLANDNSITLDDFLFLNPDLDKGCATLQLGVSYCVKPVGDITTYPRYPIQQPSTVFTRPSTTIPPPEPTTLPHAAGTESNCQLYENFFDYSSLVEKFGSAPDLDSINLCTSVAGRHGIFLDDFLRWNPSLDKQNCMLQAGYSYCVNKDGTGKDDVLFLSSHLSLFFFFFPCFGFVERYAKSSNRNDNCNIVATPNKYYYDINQYFISVDYPIADARRLGQGMQ